MPFQIIRHDITKVKADAIVNTANPYPIIGGGTDSAIYRAAGEEALLAERKKIGMIRRGDAIATPAFNLKAKYIIHTVGPVWDGGENGELDTLKACYENSLNLALKLKCKSIAFPLISSGIYGFPKDKALSIAMTTIQNFILDHEMKAYLVVFDAKSFELSGQVFDDIKSYIDANYVEETEHKEYRRRNRRDEVSSSRSYGALTESNDESFLMLQEPKLLSTETEDTGCYDDLLNIEEKTFQERFFELFDKSGLKSSEIYQPAHLSKQMFSKFQSNKDYQPTKKTAYLLCIALKLDLEETEDLLSYANISFNKANLFDMVIKSCIFHKEYDLNNIELVLQEYGCEELRKY